MNSDRFSSELLSLTGRSLLAGAEEFYVTANDRMLFQVFIYFTEAWGAINALLSMLSVFIMYRMRIYKSRVMALIFWIGLLRIVYCISTMQVCPHLDETYGLEVDEFIMCVAVQCMFRYSTGLAIGSLINLLSITAAYVIFSSKGAHPSKASYIFWVVVPSLSYGIILALQIINKSWDVEETGHFVDSERVGDIAGGGIKVTLKIYDALLALQAVIDVVCFRVLLGRMGSMKNRTEDVIYPLFQLTFRLIWYPVMQLARFATMAPWQYIYTNLGCEYLYILGTRDASTGKWVSIWIFLWAIFAPSGGIADTVIFFMVSVGAKETLQYYVEMVLRCGYVTEEARKKKKAVSWSKYSNRRGGGSIAESDRASSLTIASDDYIPPAEREERRWQQQGGGDDGGDDGISISEMSDADKDHRVEAMLGVEHEEGNHNRGGSHIIQISQWSTGAGIYRDEEEMERISEFLLADVDDDSDDANHDHDHDSSRSTTSAHEGGLFNNLFRSLRVSSGGGSRASTTMRNSNSDLVLGLNNESKKQVIHQLNEDELLDVIVRTRAKTSKQREREIQLLEQQFCEVDGSMSSGGANGMSERVSEAQEGGGGGVTSRRSSSQQQRNRQQQQLRDQEQAGAVVGARTVAFLEFFVESTEKTYHEMMREDRGRGASEIPDAAAATADDHDGLGHGGGRGPSDAEVELQSVSVTRKEKKTVKIASDDGGTTQKKGSGPITNPLHSEQ